MGEHLRFVLAAAMPAAAATASDGSICNPCADARRGLLNFRGARRGEGDRARFPGLLASPNHGPSFRPSPTILVQQDNLPPLFAQLVASRIDGPMPGGHCICSLLQ